MAAANGHEGVVRLQLDNGAGVKAKTIDGQTALYVATTYGQVDVV